MFQIKCDYVLGAPIFTAHTQCTERQMDIGIQSKTHQLGYFFFKKGEGAERELLSDWGLHNDAMLCSGVESQSMKDGEAQLGELVELGVMASTPNWNVRSSATENILPLLTSRQPKASVLPLYFQKEKSPSHLAALLPQLPGWPLHWMDGHHGGLLQNPGCSPKCLYE